MKRATLMITLLSLALSAGQLARAEGGFNANYTPASYYGDNDLVDQYQATKIMRKFSESTVALFSDSAIPLDEASGQYRMRDLNLQGKFNLQDGEAFGDQPVGAYCSGVLVAEDMILTAGHCFRPDRRGGPCERVKIVFGYAITAAGSRPSAFPAENVYSCSQIIRQEVHDDGNNISCRNGSCTQGSPSGKGADYALIRLDRRVTGRPPLAISRSRVRAGTSVGAIGHPSGLPVKIQEKGAAVRSVTDSGYFVANLDTFGGNSGSPVFNMSTMKIEGILVRGGVDYVYSSPGSDARVEDPRNPYMYSPGSANYYTQDGGRGEDVTFISEVQSLIPRSEMEAYLDSNQSVQPSRSVSQPRAVPAIYTPGTQGGPQVQPAIYYAPEPSAPQPIRI